MHERNNNKTDSDQDIKNSRSHRLPVRSNPFLKKVLSVTDGSVLFHELFQMDEIGFVLIHRKLRDHWIATDHPTLAVFLQILTRVEWKDDHKTVFTGRFEIKLKRGEMTCGRHQLSKWANISPQQCRTAINKLKSTNTITIKSTNKFSIISLVNWNKYQSTNQQNNQQTNIRATNEQQTDNKRVTTLEQLNNTIIKQSNISPNGVSSEDFIKTLKDNPAYKHIDITNELSKMDAWLSTHHGRKKTKRFIVNWLNKVETPIETKSKSVLWDCFVCGERLNESFRGRHMDIHEKEKVTRK